MSELPTINLERLMARVTEMSKIGALPGGGVCRLALTDEDKVSRDLLKSWMNDLGLDQRTDSIGNMFGRRRGQTAQAPVCIGSHLDTVGTGGCYDGSLGVLAALEVIERIDELGIETTIPIELINFTNEEGVRFTPDMMGSHVAAGGMSLEEVLKIKSVDGSVVLGDELQRIGYHGDVEPASLRASAFIELHIEQGPVLEQEEVQIACVEKVQGISWTEFVIEGQANHAGTTPMHLRKDAALVASNITNFVRTLTDDIPGQVGTIGLWEQSPNLINVVAERVRFTVDLRNTNNANLAEAESRMQAYAAEAAEKEGVVLNSNKLVRFDPVDFDDKMISLATECSNRLGYTNKRMPSGAGHDAQMMAAICPTTMVFIPSKDGISHNVHEYSSPEQIEAGANVLLNMVLELAK